MHIRHSAPILLLCIALTACGTGGDKQPRSSDSPPPTAEEIAYYDCLKKNGMTIVYTDYGAPRVDKTKPGNEAAYEACRSVLPDPKPQPADPAVLAAARKEAACLREQGVSWYPDPDPVTAEIDSTKVAPELWVALKRDHVDALWKCRPDR